MSLFLSLVLVMSFDRSDNLECGNALRCAPQPHNVLHSKHALFVCVEALGSGMWVASPVLYLLGDPLGSPMLLRCLGGLEERCGGVGGLCPVCCGSLNNAVVNVPL